MFLTAYKDLKGSVKELIMFHNYETEKIVHKASDVAEKPAIITSCSVLPPKIVMQDAINVILWMSADIYASCMTTSGGRTEQQVIIAGFLLCHWLYEWFSQAEQPNNTL